MKKKALVFDFDGTIADSLEVVFGIANEMADKFGYKKVKKEELQRLRDKTMRELLKEFGISYKDLLVISKEAKKLFNEKIEEVVPRKGLHSAFAELKKKGFVLAIVTSNSKHNAKVFLKSNELEVFDFVYSEKSLFGKDKKIKKFLLDSGVDKEDAVYVGDEVRDIEAARKVGMKSASVCWGLNSKEVLKKKGTDFIIEEPKDLLTVAQAI